VDYRLDIGLVNTHTERYCTAQDSYFVRTELLLCELSLIITLAGMICSA